MQGRGTGLEHSYMQKQTIGIHRRQGAEIEGVYLMHSASIVLRGIGIDYEAAILALLSETIFKDDH